VRKTQRPGVGTAGPLKEGFEQEPGSFSELAKSKQGKGGRSPRRKGSAFELEVVARLQELGLAAEKVPLSGAVKTSRFDHDVSCPVRGIDQRIECKRRKRAFATLDKMLGGNFALVVRDDRARVLVVMTLETFARLAAVPAEPST
jgi:hypothetical protein